MVGTNDFQNWAEGNPGANLMPLADYEASTPRQNGITVGIADGTLYNRAARQSAAIAKLVGDLIAAQGFDCLDDGNDAARLTALQGTLDKLILGRSVQDFSAPGTTNWTVPDGIYKVFVEVWGGGGGGSGASGASGAGGGYATGYFDVSPGDVIAVTVGVAGTGASSGAQAGTGGTSSLGSLCSATGGTGGGSGAGAGGVGTGGQINLRGQGGTDLDTQIVSAIGGNAPRGGFGGTTNSGGTTASPTAPGGAGGADASSSAGQAGAAGMVIIYY